MIVKNLEPAARKQPLREWPLALAAATLIVALLGKSWIAGSLNQPLVLVVWLAALCGVILVAAVAMVRHADVLANRLGEPAGTLLLTLASLFLSIVIGYSVGMFAALRAQSVSCSSGTVRSETPG